jgi:inositol oxygenase
MNLQLPWLNISRWHCEGAYMDLTNTADEKALKAVKAFNLYNLYSKSDKPVDSEALKPYYIGLINRSFQEVVQW